MRIRQLINRVKALLKKLRNPYWRAKGNYIKFCDSLPIDERAILLESEQGLVLNGNIFYILKYLSQAPEYQGFKIYLTVRGAGRRILQMLKAHGIENVQVVSLSTNAYFRALASAKYLINDTTFISNFMKREGQVYLNTWHGTPLKALGKSMRSGAHGIGNTQKNFVASDFLLFPNDYTKEHMIEDYMLENISGGQCILSGYPRNEIFFDKQSREHIRQELKLFGKRVYAYMPTFRGGTKTGRTPKSDSYMAYYLYELDKQLGEDEVLYVNLHPVVEKNSLNFAEFQHIYKFPEEYETYEFLNIADVLITDYSSVFFDFACTGRKVVLFPYDKEDYLADRGLYFSMDELPFPQPRDEKELLKELRKEKNYDDRAFLEKFCSYEGPGATQKLCDYVILGKNTGLKMEAIADNKKENVLIYAGNLSGNGITASIKALLQTIDITKRNYYITFISEIVQKDRENLRMFPEEVGFYATTGDVNLTIGNRIIRKLFKRKIITASLYMKLLGKRVWQDYERNFGCARFDTVIQFNGYEQEVILQLSTAPGKKIIFVHSDMLEEIKTRRNQRKDVLRYAYRHYDTVAVVAEGILPSTYKIAGQKDHIQVVKNAILYEEILRKSKEKITLDSYTKCSVDEEEFFAIMAANAPKFISVGRFSPEKGHLRLVEAFCKQLKKTPEAKLIIMGGSSYKNSYDELREYILNLGMEKKVILLCRVSNPYPIVKACDYFILGSFYEGFGLVLAEADILGKPVISTDIPGPRNFIRQHGGILVENSQAGIEQGLKLLGEGKVEPMAIDYMAYNQEVICEFETLLKN